MPTIINEHECMFQIVYTANRLVAHTCRRKMYIGRIFKRRLCEPLKFRCTKRKANLWVAQQLWRVIITVAQLKGKMVPWCAGGNVTTCILGLKIGSSKSNRRCRLLQNMFKQSSCALGGEAPGKCWRQCFQPITKVFTGEKLKPWVKRLTRDVDESNGITAVPGKRTAAICLIIQALVVKILSLVLTYFPHWQLKLLCPPN